MTVPAAPERSVALRTNVVWTTDNSWVSIDFPVKLTPQEFAEMEEFIMLWLRTQRRLAGTAP